MRRRYVLHVHAEKVYRWKGFVERMHVAFRGGRRCCISAWIMERCGAPKRSVPYTLTIARVAKDGNATFLPNGERERVLMGDYSFSACYLSNSGWPNGQPLRVTFERGKRRRKTRA